MLRCTHRRGLQLLAAAVALGGIALASCGNSKKNSGGIGSGPLDQYVAALQRCGVLTAGRAPNGVFEAPEGDATQLACISACVSKATCDDIAASFCEQSGALDACVSDCYSFRCGDGTQVPEDARCDDETDCADGSDELNCEATKFNCGSGEVIPKAYVCDDSTDCEDRSDEAGCPAFTCADGETIWPDYRCDGGQDCEDGSDEVNCPSFTCPDGTAVLQSLVCNGADDCDDGADEIGCAEITCPVDPERLE
jgi:hypothetical protein